MKQLVIALSLVIIPQMAIAQIELDANGNVSAGNTSPVSTTTLFIQAGSNNHVGAETRSENSGGNRYGLISRATSGDRTHGVWTKAIGGSIANYGIVSTASGATAYAGYFYGNVWSSGTYAGSDRKLKENIADINGESALQKLMQLRPRSYTYKQTGEYKEMNLSRGTQYGLIAQEVETLFPELVKETISPAAIDENGIETGTSVSFKSLNYNALIPLLLKAIQEQQAEIDQLKQALESR